jgi:putative nucleotidyltransferase with HDIG domain
MIKKISVDQLKTGMYVVKLDRPWLNTPFLSSRFLIKTPEQIEKLKAYCKNVDIDTEKGCDDTGSLGDRLQGSAPMPAETGASGATKDRDGGQKDARFDIAIHQALEVRNKTKQMVDQMMEDVRMGKSVDATGARETVENIIDGITLNQDALLFLTQLKNRDEYTSIHSMNVCIISIAFTRYLGLREEQIRLIGIGALLHDIGKMLVPMEILNKPGKLNEEEFRLMKNHVMCGAKILERSPGIPPQALKVVLEHHERFKGNGYPRGLSEGEISFMGQLAAIIDVYDAITSDRVYHDHILPHDAVKRMYEWSERDFNRKLLEKFIKCIGIYPLGSMVEVNGTEIDFIISANPKSALKPDVLLVKDRNGRLYKPPLKISLTEKLSPHGKEKWAITRVLDPVAENGRIDSFLKISV